MGGGEAATIWNGSYCALFLHSRGDAQGGFEYGLARLLLAGRGHADDGGGETDGGDDRMAVGPDGGTEADSAEDRLLAVAGYAGLADGFELGEEFGAVGDGVVGAAGETVDLEDAVGEIAALEGGDGLAHGAAVRGKDASDAVGHADFVEGFDGVEDVDAVVVEVGEGGSFVETVDEAFEFGAGFGAHGVGLLDEPAEAEFGRELVGAVDGLLEVGVFFEREEHAEERGFGESGAGGDVLEGERGFAVEAVEDVERATDGAEVVLLAGGGVGAGLESPLGDAAANGFVWGGGGLVFGHESTVALAGLLGAAF